MQKLSGHPSTDDIFGMFFVPFRLAPQSRLHIQHKVVELAILCLHPPFGVFDGTQIIEIGHKSYQPWEEVSFTPLNDVYMILLSHI